MTLVDKAEALAPCPFCGGGLLWSDTYREYHHPRAKCILSGHKFKKGVIAAWNRRAALPARGVGVATEAQFMNAVWAALKADATDLGKQQRILAAFRAALNVTDMTEPAPTAAEAREAKSWDELSDEQIHAAMNAIQRETETSRKAAILEAANVCKVFQSNARTNDAWLHACEIEEAILALIEDRDD